MKTTWSYANVMRRMPIFLLPVAVVALLGILLHTSPEWTIDAGSPGDVLFLSGFFAPEREDNTTFRWSGLNSRLVLHGAPAAPLNLAIRLHGDELAKRDDPRIYLRHNGHLVTTFRVTPGWRVYRVLLPAGAAVGALGVATPLDFATAAYCPAQDSRVLGVPVDWIQIHPMSTPLLPTVVSRLWSLLLTVAVSVPASLLVLISSQALFLAAWLILALPGVLLAHLLFGFEQDRLPMLFLMVCSALALPALLLLLLHILPGSIPWWLLLGISIILSIGILSLENKEPGTEDLEPEAESSHRFSRWYFAVIAVLILAAVFRLVYLGSAEFQGDEARAMLMAMGVQHGQDEILLLHRKGPMEILLPALPLVLIGKINEWAARLPFACAGIGIIFGSFLLAREMFSSPGRNDIGVAVGVVAAGILALDGFLIAFSRIVQYQSVLMLMAIGAMLCCWRFYAGTMHPQRYLTSGAAMAAVGLLAHYDGIYVLPALTWLVLTGGLRRWHHNWHLWLRGLSLPLLVGGGLLLSFYLPFITDEHFQRTSGYLAERVTQPGTVNLLVNNLLNHYERATFYNTTFQILWLTVSLVMGVLTWLVMYARSHIAGWLLAGLLVIGCSLLIVNPGLFNLGHGINWAIIPFGLPLLGLASFRATPSPLRVLVIWFGVPFVAHAFLIGDPRTHFYTMNAAAALLIALATVQLFVWLQAHGLLRLQVALGIAGGGVVLLSVPYLYLVFIQQWPEYYRSFPAYRPNIYAASYGNKVPEGGHFGFPHRDGWKTVGELYQRGVLQGSYNANQRDRISGWYTRGAVRCEQRPDYFFLAKQEGLSLPRDLADYDRAACVLVDGTRMMDVYAQRTVSHSGETPQAFVQEDYAPAFDARPVTHFPIQQSLLEIVPQHRMHAQWQRGITLLGYDLLQSSVRNQQLTTLSLYWSATEPLVEYALLVKVVNPDGTIAGNIKPLCGPNPPATWSTQYINTTAFTVQTNEPAQPDTYTIQISLRHRVTNEPLLLTDGSDSARIVP